MRKALDSRLRGNDDTVADYSASAAKKKRPEPEGPAA
jgi:hypothetical protein